MFPDFVLAEEEREEHEKPSVVNDPPYVYVTLHPVLVARIPVYPLGNQHSLLHGRCNSYGLWSNGGGGVEWGP